MTDESQSPANKRAPRPAHLPLQGVRVLAVEQFGAGPYGTMYLAHLGADVIKIENPAVRGDPARHTGPFFLGADDSQYFQGWNSNKSSITLDIKSPGGRKAFEALVRDVDVVFNNLRGDQPAKIGLDYATLSGLNPAIVCAHLSAYGRDNSRAAWPGYDYLMQAESGLMHLTGEPGTPPARLGAPSIVDHMTGVVAIVGVLAALLRARETGQGCDVDTNLFDVAMHQLGYVSTWFLNEGFESARQPRSAHYSVAPVQTYPTADGWIFVMCMTDKFWLALLDVLGRLDLAARPEFASRATRHENQTQLTEILDAEFRCKPTSYWLAKLQGVLPVAPVHSVSEALESDFVRESGLVAQLKHPAHAQLRVLANPLKFDGQRPAMRAGSPLGADTGAVLSATSTEGQSS